MKYGTTTENRDVKPHIAIYAMGKLGKTTFLADAARDAKKGLFVMCGEDGLSELKLANIPKLADGEGNPIVFGRNQTPKEWEEFADFMKYLITENHSYDTICFDGLNLIINGCVKNHIIEHCIELKHSTGDAAIDFAAKNKKAHQFGGIEHIKHTRDYFNKIITAFEILQSRGVTIYSSYHALPTKWNPPDVEEGYKRWTPDLPACGDVDIRQILKNKCSFLLFGCTDGIVKINTLGANKGIGGDNRILRSDYNLAYDAASRYNFPATIDFKYSVFKSTLEGVLNNAK
jgi:hypothetical protein